nr:ABC transporter permease [Streptomyces sp. TS71-3]
MFPAGPDARHAQPGALRAEPGAHPAEPGALRGDRDALRGDRDALRGDPGALQREPGVLHGTAADALRREPDAVPLAPRARLLPALAAVYRAQLSRARVARIPLLFVATFQSVGIMILMRGVVDDAGGARAVVAGSSVLVVAFVALNLLAQYFGQLRAGGGLDHYATLPVPPAAVVLGAAAAYASFTVPGTVATAVVGCGLFQLPLGHLWVLAVVIPLAGAALSGLGAALGLLAPRPELATLLGQLGMSAALLLGVLPAGRMPAVVQGVRDLLPSTYGVEAFERTFAAHPDWAAVGLDLAVCAAVGVVSLAVATWAYRRAAVR